MKFLSFSSVLLMSVLLSTLDLCGQIMPSKYLKMEALTIQDGLSQGMINCIYQDHFGFMWFGTMDGLNKYDGYHFTVYRYDVNDPFSISGNLITSIFEDSKGRLWVGTGLNGLNVFIRETEKFIHLQYENGKPNTISGNGILSIQEDQLGAIWVGTSHGLNKIVFQEKTTTSGKVSNDIFSQYEILIKQIKLNPSHPTVELYISYEETGKNDYFEPSFFIDSKGVIWISTFKAIFQIKSSKDFEPRVEKFDVTKLLPDTASINNMENQVFNYVEDTSRHELYLMRRRYITIINQNTGETSFFHCGKVDPGVLRTQGIINAGLLWVSSNSSLFQYDLKNKKIWQVRPKNNDQLTMIDFANTVYKDHGGLIWIGSKGYGILRYNPRTEKFNSFNLSSVLWMSATPNNDIIIASKKLGLFRYNTTRKEFVSDTSFFRKVYDAAPEKIPDVAVQNNQGICWVNISSLIQFDPQKNSIKTYPYSACFPLFVDPKDNLWFGNKASFCNLDKNTGTVKEYAYPFKIINLYAYNFLEAIDYDDGIFWLGTTNGLLRFDEKNTTWKHFKNKSNDHTTLSTDIIFSICKDPLYPEKFLWIGTNGGGLNCLNKLTGKFTRYTEKDGLPNNVVYGILSDDDGNLWMSTNKGLSRFTPKYVTTFNNFSSEINGGVFKNFEEEAGLQSNEFNRNAFTKSKDGTLFFGGVNGFNYFNPKEINDVSVMPKVVFTDFKVNNKSVKFSNYTSKERMKLSKPVYLTEEIVLPYQDNMISFEFSSMDFTAPHKNLFQYRLEGFDKEWIKSGTNNIATYTNLDPGNYKLHVIGSNNDEVWNETGTSISLTILSPWYMTWWFKITLLILIISPLYVIWRYRLKQTIKLLEVRNRIASDLHDEIGSTLSSVYIYSEVAQKAANEKLPDTNIYLKQISVDVASMIESLGDIVWTVNAKNDRFENIINRMRATAFELFEAREYHLHLDIDEHLNTLKLGMDARKNFYLFYKEAINNVAKYAFGKNVFIKLSLAKGKIVLIVKDDGKGFDSNIKKEGNGLSNMKKRASNLNGECEIHAVTGIGTEVKLSFPCS